MHRARESGSTTTVCLDALKAIRQGYLAMKRQSSRPRIIGSTGHARHPRAGDFAEGSRHTQTAKDVVFEVGRPDFLDSSL